MSIAISISEKYLVPGARALLEALKERGLKLYLASGTDQQYMREEARLLDVDRYFDLGKVPGTRRARAARSAEGARAEAVSRERHRSAVHARGGAAARCRSLFRSRKSTWYPARARCSKR